MNHRSHHRTLSILACACCAASFTGVAPAQEIEVTCAEGAEPMPMSYGAHSSGCAISPATDGDGFSFLGLAGDRVRIVLMGNTNGFDPRLELRAPDDALIEAKTCTAPWNGVCGVVIEQTLEATGTYEIRVSEAQSNETGGYTLQLERMPPLLPPPSIGFGTSVYGSISPKTDVDFLSFEGVAGTTVRLVLLGQTNGLDPQIELIDPDGVTLANPSCASAWNGVCTITLEQTLEIGGQYAIAIHESGYNETGNYQIALQCVVGNCPCFERDIDGDGAVGFQDLLEVLVNWGPCEACPADLHPDGVVDFNDLLLLLNSWGPCE